MRGEPAWAPSTGSWAGEGGCSPPASLLSGAVYLFEGLVPAFAAVPVTLGVFLGGALGAKLLNTLPLKAVSLLFELVMLAAGVRLLLP